MKEGEGLVGGGRPARSEGELLNAVNRLRDGLRHIDERWQDCLTLNNAGLIEKYLSGHFSIALKFGHPTMPQQALDLAVGEREFCDGHLIVVTISKANVANAQWDDDGEQEPMLVPIVELAEGPQKAVRSLVRAYLVKDDPADAGNGHLYSVVRAFLTAPPAGRAGVRAVGREGSFQFLPRFVEREGQGGVLTPEKLSQRVVERAPEIVYRVSGDQEQICGDGASGFGLKDVFGAIRIILHDDFCEIALQKPFAGGLELCDVLIGPYQLYAGVSEQIPVCDHD